MYTSELYLNSSYITKDEWHSFILTISKYNGYFHNWSLLIKIYNNKIYYYIKTSVKLPSTISSTSKFMIRNIPSILIKSNYLTIPTYLPIESNIIDCFNYCHIKNIGDIKYITIKFRRISEDKYLSKTHIYFSNEDKLIKSRVVLAIPSNLLSIDFKKNKIFQYQKANNYFDISKIYHLLKTEQSNTNVLIDTFPYLDGNFYLNLNNVDFNRHSLILGSSGSGKSKFIASLIKNINDSYKDNYKIVMIDPHASIENDIGAISHIINFQTIEESINLFSTSSSDIIATTELTLDLFKTLLSNQYNSKLERVLRHSIYLLLFTNDFNFNTLKLLITDSIYRTDIINKVRNKIPESIIHFFLNDFNDLRTKSYGEAISPIISFIDEMSMIPVFNNDTIPYSLEDSIKNNFITLFSLDKTILGDRVTKTISGFIMEQLLVFIESAKIPEHIIFIIDEVPVIENSILSRFLSEARKYNLSLILAGQYFNQISDSLKNSIFANVINYYTFRVSRTDANLLVNHLNMKIPNISDKTIEEQKEEKINLLSNLNNRECLIRLSSNNILTPCFKAKTLDFIPMPTIKKEKVETQKIESEKKSSIVSDFTISNTNLKEILSRTSSSRMVVKQ